VTAPPAPALLSPAELRATAATIAASQYADGMIPRVAGGHADPWNHVEAAMGLAVAGWRGEAERAYRWLAATQLPCGGWHAFTNAAGVEDARVDTNFSAYLATGVWHHTLLTGDLGFLAEMWPVLERAIEFVLSHQQPGGEITWNVDEDGVPGGYALLTGSSSIYFSLRCAVAAAERLGHERPDWELAAGRVRHAVAYRREAFEPKDRFAMDWYYPVLSGALGAAAAQERLDERWDELVMPGHGVRCVDDGNWVTTAETAECAMACAVAGRAGTGVELLGWLDEQRNADGSYLTGTVYPQRSTFPAGEVTTYSAAAVILATDALARVTPASGLFHGEGLPCGLDLDSDRIDDPA
jgi:hypothetical protein